MNWSQKNTRKNLLEAIAVLFVLLAMAESASASACNQDPCPPTCEGKRCQ